MQTFRTEICESQLIVVQGRLDRSYQRLKDLQAAKKRLAIQKGDLKRQLEESEAKRTAEEESRTNAEKQYKQIKMQLIELQGKLYESNRSLTDFDATKIRLAIKNDDLTRQLEEAEAKRTADEESRANAEKQYKQMEMQLIELQGKLDESNRSLSDFDATNKQLAIENGDLTRQLEKAEAKRTADEESWPFPDPFEPTMSDTPQNTAIILDQVQHDTCLPAKIEALFCSKACSDITLLVEGQKIPSHKLILASRSDFFRDLLYGENKNVTELKLEDTPISSFIVVLQYIYTGRIVVDSQAENSTPVVLDVLVLAHRYGFRSLESSISSYLQSLLSEKNLSTIYEYVRKLEWSLLGKACQSFADSHAEDVIGDKSFLQLSSEAMREVISRDPFIIPEVKIFNTVYAWKQKHPDQDVENLLSAVRLPLMEQQDLLNVVLPTRLISSEVILEAFKQKKEGGISTFPRYRGHLVIGQNLATESYEAEVIHGLQPQNLLAEPLGGYDDTKGITAHKIGEENGQGIVVKLGKPYIVNYIRLWMMDREFRAYSYYLEVSVNNEEWVEVIDCRNYQCRSWQYLYFEPQVVRYIRIVGTKNYSGKPHFGLVKLFCEFSTEEVNVQNGFLCPTFAKHCISYIGDNQTGQSDINLVDIPSTDKVVQISFAQPIFVDFIRLQLSENKEDKFKFYIEVSTDGTNWCKVVDKQDEEYSGCQKERFPERVILMIRFVATFYSGGDEEEFTLKGFDCYYKGPVKVKALPSPIITQEAVPTAEDEPVKEAEIPPTEPEAEGHEATEEAEETPFIPTAFCSNEMLEKPSSGRWGLILGVIFCFAVLVVLCYV